MGMLYFFKYINYFYAKYEKHIFVIANMFAVILLASCQGAFEVEQQLLHNMGPAQTNEPLCESSGVEQPLHSTCLAHTKEHLYRFPSSRALLT